MGQILSFILKLVGSKSRSSNTRYSRDETPAHLQYHHLPGECCIDVVVDHPNLNRSPNLNPLLVDAIIDRYNPKPNPPPVDVIIDHPKPPLVDAIIDRYNPKLNPPPVDVIIDHPKSPLVEACYSEFAKRIGPYIGSQKILLVGEGDFSFSASLALAFGSASNMVATSLNSFEFLSQNYRHFCSNMRKLLARGCIVLHGIDATKMSTHPQLSAIKFDCIVFNFPHSGFRSDNESLLDELGRHQKLVSGFLRNAKKMIVKKGEIHIRHKSNAFFLKWNIPKLASNQGLLLIKESDFVRSVFPGYYTKYGFGGDKNFNCNPSKTYIFGLMHY